MAAPPGRAGRPCARSSPSSRARTSLNRIVGPDRTLALIRSSLDRSSRSRTRTTRRSTTFCWRSPPAACAGSCDSRGEAVDDLAVPIYVPVTLRPAQPRSGTGKPDRADARPASRSGRRSRSDGCGRSPPRPPRRKARSHPPGRRAAQSDRPAGAARRSWTGNRVNVTTADLPGPPQPVYLAGARLLEVFPVLPLIANVSLGVSAPCPTPDSSTSRRSPTGTVPRPGRLRHGCPRRTGGSCSAGVSRAPIGAGLLIMSG